MRFPMTAVCVLAMAGVAQAQTTWYVDDDCPEICLGTVVTRASGEGLDTVIDGFMIAGGLSGMFNFNSSPTATGTSTSCRHREGMIPKDNTFW